MHVVQILLKVNELINQFLRLLNHSTQPLTCVCYPEMGGGWGWPLCNLEIIRGSLPSSAAIREYREGSSGSKSRAVISKMARLLNDNSQASLPVSLSFTAADYKN